MRLLSYTPSHCDPALLERLTSGQSRKALITTLTDAVREELGRTSHQHQLVIGPRGSGKTHVLTLVRHALNTDPQVAGKLMVVHLAEEEVIRQPADLLIRILERLILQLPARPANAAARERITAHLSRLRTQGRHEHALDLAAAALEDAAQALGVLLVATIENLDAILFAGASLSRAGALDPQWGLRKALQQSAGLVVIASAPTFFGEVTDPKAPFYNFFRTHSLEELSNDEMLSLLRTRLQTELHASFGDERRHRRLQLLEDGFDERAPKLRGLLTLTGGLPRFGHLIFDLLVEVDASSIMDTLEAFLDQQTPYFQPKLDPRMVPEGELEVLDALASAPGPLTVSELAGLLRAGTSNAAAMYLKRLRGRGLVRERRAGARTVHYDVAEPLFRIWRRFRIGRSEQEQILMLAEFVAAMFSPAELLADRAALREAPSSDARGIELLNQAIRVSRPEVEAVAGEENELFAEALRAFEKKDLARAMALVDEGVLRARKAGDAEVRGAWAWLRGEVLGKLGRRDAADAFQEAALALAEVGHEEMRGFCLHRRATVLTEFALWEDAAQAFGEAAQALTGELRGHALLLRAGAFMKLKQPERAAQSYVEAAACFARVPDRGTILLRHCADQLSELGKHEEAIAFYRSTADLLLNERNYHGRADCLMNAGDLLLKLGRGAEALQEYAKAGASYARLRDPEEHAKGFLRITRSLARLLGAQPDPAPIVSEFTVSLARPAEQEDGREAVIVIARAILESHGPETLLEILPRLEGALPASHSSLLRPLRLAAEVLTKRRPENMTDEPEEMHRAVDDVISWVRMTARWASQSPRPLPDRASLPVRSR